ncbi:MAG: purine-binding chemotaxis protein CheW [Candidatus Omnitrophica bacterium]|nr:purine-binding chemotaxis protein CheW [Candidatus Omnitrophota bacterium]
MATEKTFNYYLIFRMDKKEYGVRVDQVIEVVKIEPVTKLPQGPDFLEGVISLRGRSLAIMDLRKRLQVPSAVKPTEGSVIMVRTGGLVLGLWVDKAFDVIEIADCEIDTASQLGGEFMRGGLFVGVAHIHQKEILLVDLEKILAADEVGILEKHQADPQMPQTR